MTRLESMTATRRLPRQWFALMQDYVAVEAGTPSASQAAFEHARQHRQETLDVMKAVRARGELPLYMEKPLADILAQPAVIS